MAGGCASSSELLRFWRFVVVSLFLLIECSVVLSQEQYLVKTIKSFEKGVFFYDIEVDRNHPDYIYATDLESHCIRVYNNRTGEVKVFAGQEKHGYQDGYRLDALFYKPRELCQTPDGALYVVDSGNFVIRKIDTLTGNVTTVAGNHSESGSKDGAGSEARFTGQVVGIKCLADGTLLVADPGDPSKEGGGTLRKVACPDCPVPPAPDPPPEPFPSPDPTPPGPIPPRPSGTPNYAKLSIATNIILVMLLFIIVIPKFLPNEGGHHMGHHRSSSMAAYDMLEEGEYAPLMPDFGITAYPTNSISSTTSSRNGRRRHRKTNSLVSQRFNLYTPTPPLGYGQGPPSVCESMDDNSTMATQGTAAHVPSLLMHDDGHDSLPPTPFHPDHLHHHHVPEEHQPNLMRRSAGHRSEDDFMYHEFESDVDLDSQPATPYASDTDEVQHVTRHPFASGRTTNPLLTAHLLQQHNMMASHLLPSNSAASGSALPPLPGSRIPPNAPGRPPLPRSSNKTGEGKKWPQAASEPRPFTPGGGGSEDGSGAVTPVRRPPVPPVSPFAASEVQVASATPRQSPLPSARDMSSREGSIGMLSPQRPGSDHNERVLHSGPAAGASTPTGSGPSAFTLHGAATGVTPRASSSSATTPKDR